MTPRYQDAARRLLPALTVAFMMIVGFLVLICATATDPDNMDTAAQTMPDLAAARALFGLLTLLTLPFYRRATLIPLIAGAFSAVGIGMDPFVLAVALAVWIGRAEKPWHWWTAAGGVAVIGVNAAVHLRAVQQYPSAEERQLGTALIIAILLLCLSLVAGVAMWIRQRRRASRAAARARQADRSTVQLSDELTRQREREDLAREVHDTLASRLSTIALQTGSLEDAARQSGDQNLDAAMRTVNDQAHQALDDLRSLLTSLREGGAPAAEPLGVPGSVADLQDLFEDAGAAGLTVRPYVLLDGYGEAPDALRRAVVRIIREALTNALRHSDDAVADVRLEGGPGKGLSLEFSNGYVEDDAFDGGSETGLLGMQERVNLAGGVLWHDRSHGRFTVVVRLPWPAP